jgi:hypothetical protein
MTMPGNNVSARILKAESTFQIGVADGSKGCVVLIPVSMTEWYQGKDMKTGTALRVVLYVGLGCGPVSFTAPKGDDSFAVDLLDTMPCTPKAVIEDAIYDLMERPGPPVVVT